MLKKLEHLLAIAEITLSDEQKNQLINYVFLLDKWNKTYNLTSVRDPQQMLIRHIMDSIVVKPYLQGDKFIDVGTGAGLPGIPLAIICPNIHFTLLDSLGKRVRFLRQVKNELQLNNIAPIQSRVEDFVTEVKFHGVISRAFASLTDMLSCCYHLVDKNEGHFYALKGKKPNKELINLSEGMTTILSINKLSVPELAEERHLIIIKLNAEIKNLNLND